VKAWLAPVGSVLTTWLGAVLVTFMLVEAAPGDFLSEAQWHAALAPDTVSLLRERYGLDQPWPERAWRWMRGLVSGDWGHSLSRDLPVWPLLRERAMQTLQLALVAQLIAWSAALALGFVALDRPRGALAHATRAVAVLLLCIPEVVLALVAVLLLTSIDGGTAPFWPALLALSVATFPGTWLQVTTALAEAQRLPFVEAAATQGVRRGTWLLGYLLPAMAPALLGYASVSFGNLLGVSLLVECVTAYPGLGPLLVDAVLARDLHVVAGAVLLSTLLWSSGTLLADLVQRAVDPRQRLTR
jgi:peptide/nickel transport system permease protein